MKTEIVYSHSFDKHDNQFHPENAYRTDVMINSLKRSEIIDEVSIVEPTLIPEVNLYQVHTEEVIRQVKDLSFNGGHIDIDTYVSRNDYETARLAAGGMLSLCKRVMDGQVDNGFALVRPPGHHATRSRSMGFCLFNNISLSAEEFVRMGKKVCIFDLDVHHGNGTQDIFYSSDQVLYQSFHLSPHFPGTGDIDEIGVDKGLGYTVNAPLYRHTGEHTVNNLFDEVFIPIMKQFDPDILLVSSGFDSHFADQMGGLFLSANYFGEMIEKLQTVQPKIVCTLEGGYNLKNIGNCFVSQIGQLCGKPQHIDGDPIEDTIDSKIVKQLIDMMNPYWDV